MTRFDDPGHVINDEVYDKVYNFLGGRGGCTKFLTESFIQLLILNYALFELPVRLI